MYMSINNSIKTFFYTLCTTSTTNTHVWYTLHTRDNLILCISDIRVDQFCYYYNLEDALLEVAIAIPYGTTKLLLLLF